MKIAEIRKFDTRELTKKSTELRNEISLMRQKLALGELQNPRTIRKNEKT